LACIGVEAPGEEFEQLLPSLDSRRFRCSHSKPGLHPRVARRGKLLPRHVYDQLQALMQADREYFGLEGDDIAGDLIVRPSRNLECKDCREDYRDHLARKLQLVVTARDLFFMFKHDPPPLEYEADEVLSPGDEFVYIVSTKFITKFSKAVAGLMKTSKLADSTDNPANLPQICPETESIVEGIDALDLAMISPIEACAEISTKEADNIDIAVNSNLICKFLLFLIFEELLAIVLHAVSLPRYQQVLTGISVRL